jgi:hypothetical protein
MSQRMLVEVLSRSNHTNTIQNAFISNTGKSNHISNIPRDAIIVQNKSNHITLVSIMSINTNLETCDYKYYRVIKYVRIIRKSILVGSFIMLSLCNHMQLYSCPNNINYSWNMGFLLYQLVSIQIV